MFVKAGASTVDLETVEDDNRYFRMNVDKGNQSNGGESMVVLGNLTHPEVAGSEFRIKSLDTTDLSLNAEADGDGRVWLIVGTDSGFEGLTAIYYSRISYALSAVTVAWGVRKCFIPHWDQLSPTFQFALHPRRFRPSIGGPEPSGPGALQESAGVRQGAAGAVGGGVNAGCNAKRGSPS